MSGTTTGNSARVSLSESIRAIVVAILTPLLEKNVVKTFGIEIPLVFSMTRVIVLAFAAAMLHQIWHSGIADPHTGGQYTLKVYTSEKAAASDGEWQHTRVVLKPLNPAYEPIVGLEAGGARRAYPVDVLAKERTSTTGSAGRRCW